jgi:primase-polymerase (primpol)-like protein
MADEAARHIAMLDSYAEISVSGSGVHCLAWGNLPPGPRKRRSHELYCDKRFFVVTGKRLPGSPRHVEYREAALLSLHKEIFGSSEGCVLTAKPAIYECPKTVTQSPPYTQKGRGGGEQRNKSVRSSWTRADSKVLALVMEDRVAARYWRGCPKGVNHSRADWALACKLGKHTGWNLEQMDRLFRQSALAQRPKAETRRGGVDYIRYTLEEACRRQQAVWDPNRGEVNEPGRPGRKPSAITQSVLELAAKCPEFAPREIASKLGLTPAAVRIVLHRKRTATAAGAERQVSA